MAISRRREIINFIKDKIALINGGTSTLKTGYLYLTNLSGNSFRQIRFLDEVNDFPSVYLQADSEVRIHHSSQLTEALLPIAIRCYVHAEDPIVFLNNLIQDIEHIIYNIPTTTKNLGIMDITIDSISTDEGLATPFGIGEVFITVQYDLER